MLGFTATDKVTGLTGVVTARAEFIYGPVRYEVTPQKLHKGQPAASQWHDADRWAFGKPAFGFDEPPCNVNLGDVVIDNLTGFRGVATGRFTFLNGCIRFEISPPKLKDGEPVKPCTVDLPQITVVKRAKATKPTPTPTPASVKKSPGGPHDGPPDYRVPSRH